MQNLIRILFILQFFIISCSCSKNNDVIEEEVITVPPMSDQEILDLAQKDAFKYFWNYAEINSKLARERYHTDDSSFESNKVTTGGSGFVVPFLPVSKTLVAIMEKGRFFKKAMAYWVDVLPISPRLASAMVNISG